MRRKKCAILSVFLLLVGLGDQDLITIEDRETMVKYFPRAVERFDEDNDNSEYIIFESRLYSKF